VKFLAHNNEWPHTYLITHTTTFIKCEPLSSIQVWYSATVSSS